MAMTGAYPLDALGSGPIPDRYGAEDLIVFQGIWMTKEEAAKRQAEMRVIARLEDRRVPPMIDG